MSLRRMTAIAIFAALLAVCSQFFLPIGPVPHTLQIFAITLAGIVLGAKDGAASVVVWILLGSFGLPVFAMAQAGPAVVFGPLVGFFGDLFFMPPSAVICAAGARRQPFSVPLFRWPQSTLRVSSAFGRSICTFSKSPYPCTRPLRSAPCLLSPLIL